MKLFANLERKFGRYAIKNLSLILIVCYVAGYIIQFAAPSFQSYLQLDPYAIVHGQVWRIVSWILIPPPESNMFFAIIMLVFYYSIGTLLERTWGSYWYNVYLFSGMIFTVLGSFLMMGFCYIFKYAAAGSVVTLEGVSYHVNDSGFLIKLMADGALKYHTLAPATYFAEISKAFSTYYVNMSIFLAYAATFPDNQVLLMFFIPIKVKILGFIYGAFLIYELISGIFLNGQFGFVIPFVIGSSLINFIVFFFSTRRYIRFTRTQRKQHAAFVRQVKEAQQRAAESITKHRCAICGRTEKDGDEHTFRFCSKCDGNYEFCEDHLYTHIHFTGDRGPQ